MSKYKFVSMRVSLFCLLITAVITAAAPELRTANNTAVSITFIGRLAYLPVIFE